MGNVGSRMVPCNRSEQQHSSCFTVFFNSVNIIFSRQNNSLRTNFGLEETDSETTNCKNENSNARGRPPEVFEAGGQVSADSLKSWRCMDSGHSSHIEDGRWSPVVSDEDGSFYFSSPQWPHLVSVLEYQLPPPFTVHPSVPRLSRQPPLGKATFWSKLPTHDDVNRELRERSRGMEVLGSAHWTRAPPAGREDYIIPTLYTPLLALLSLNPEQQKCTIYAIYERGRGIVKTHSYFQQNLKPPLYKNYCIHWSICCHTKKKK